VETLEPLLLPVLPCEPKNMFAKIDIFAKVYMFLLRGNTLQ